MRHPLQIVGLFDVGRLGLALTTLLTIGYALAKIPATSVGLVFDFSSRRVLLSTKNSTT